MLHSLSESEDDAFDVVVADDGSGDETARVIERRSAAFGERLQHVWHPDEGWRHARALNLAATKADGDYLVFLDGDVVPRRSFIGAVRRGALPGWFLAGKRVFLEEEFSRRVLERHDPVLVLVDSTLARPRAASDRPPRLPPAVAGSPPAVAPRGRGLRPAGERVRLLHRVSRADFERVNGRDMRYQGWGEEDRDLAERLGKIGLRCGFPGPGATLFHLWHPTSKQRKNVALLEETEASDRVEAVLGLRELADELANVP